MITVITKLIIASAGLWLALPAAAQFEIDPDHFGDSPPTVAQTRLEQSKGSMKISLPYKQVQPHHLQTFKGRKGPASPQRTLSGATDVVRCSGRPPPRSLWHKWGRAGAC